MQNFNPARAILGGLMATIIMTALVYAGPVVGLARLDFAALIGMLFSTVTPRMFSTRWWAGMTVHFINGAIIFPLFYAYVLFPILPGVNALKGALWGAILWLISETLLLPVMGLGFFSTGAPQPLAWTIFNLAAHLVYGSVLGAVAGEQRSPLPGTERYMAQSRERVHEYLTRNKMQRKG